MVLHSLVRTLILVVCPSRMKDSLAVSRILTTSGLTTALAISIFRIFLYLVLPTRFQQGPQAWYNPAAFTVPPPFTYGTLGRNTLRGPKFENLDFALFKNFKFTESKSLQFRSEFFNILNNVNFAPPGGAASGGFSTLGGESKTSVGTPQFMQIRTAAAA